MAESLQHEPNFEVIGADDPSDELLELLADILLDMVGTEESKDAE